MLDKIIYLPYPNYHAARVRSPDDFVHIVVLKTLPNGIMIYGGPLKSNPSGGTTAQTYRFPKSKFTAAEAKKWLADHDIKYILFEPATGKSASISQYGFIHEGQFPISTCAKQEPKDDDPVQKFKKDILRIGHYVHPDFGWELDITEERLHRFVAAFKSMKENGVDVEVVMNHSRDAADTLGYGVEMFVEPDEDGVPTLWAIHEIRGLDAIDIVRRNRNVSVGIDRDFVDGMDRHYGEAIIHISISQQPVVPGQGDFIPIAASRVSSGETIPIFHLSKGEPMDKELLQKIRDLLGAGDDLTDENALSRIEERLNADRQAKEDLQKQVVDLKGKLESAGKSEASRNTPKIDPHSLELTARSTERELSHLVKSGKITPAVKDQLFAALVGERGNRKTISLALGDNGQASIAEAVIEALEKNDIVKLGELTGMQVLSRTIPDETNAVEAAKQQKEVTDEMVEMAGGSEDGQKQT